MKKQAIGWYPKGIPSWIQERAADLFSKGASIHQGSPSLVQEMGVSGHDQLNIVNWSPLASDQYQMTTALTIEQRIRAKDTSYLDLFPALHKICTVIVCPHCQAVLGFFWGTNLQDDFVDLHYTCYAKRSFTLQEVIKADGTTEVISNYYAQWYGAYVLNVHPATRAIHFECCCGVSDFGKWVDHQLIPLESLHGH